MVPLTGPSLGAVDPSRKVLAREQALACNTEAKPKRSDQRYNALANHDFMKGGVYQEIIPRGRVQD